MTILLSRATSSGGNRRAWASNSARPTGRRENGGSRRFFEARAPRGDGERRLQSKRGRKSPAVDQQILPGDVTGVHRAEKRAGRAELRRVAEAPRRNAGDAVGGHLRDALALLLGRFAQRAAQAVRVE